MELNALTSRIIHAAIVVHKELGPGLLESVYHRCMEIELEASGLSLQSELIAPVVYKGIEIDREGLRLDLLVNNSVIVELKSVEAVRDVHKKQLLTYLRLMRKRAGLLINFNESLLKEGITRILNGFVSETSL